MLSKIFSKQKSSPNPAFEPDARFCIGALEMLVNSLADNRTFKNAFDGVPHWDIDYGRSDRILVSHKPQMTGGLLLDDAFQLTFGYATQAFLEFMVVDMWVKLREFSFSGFESVPDGPYASKAVLPVGANAQIVFKVKTSRELEPYNGLVVPGSLLHAQFSGQI